MPLQRTAASGQVGRAPERRRRSRRHLLTLAIFSLSQAATAQQVPPGAGSQLQQIPAPPALPRAAPEVRIQPASPQSSTNGESVRITVRLLNLVGASLYSEADLLAVSGFVPGSELTLDELQVIAGRITVLYQRNGYFLARAWLPPQDIRDQTVTIEVSEGRYGKVELRNQSRLADSIAAARLQGLGSGDPIRDAPLEQRLMSLSDIPGIDVRSTLVPGTAAGTSDLLVDVNPGRPVTGSVDFDNAGNRYTGEYRLGATVNVNNALGLGDMFTVRGLTSGQGLNYGSFAWQVPAGRGTVGVGYSRLNYSLGKEFAALQAHGTAEVASVFGRYPLVRSRNDNLYAQLGLDVKRFEDRVDTVPSVTNRRSALVTGSLYGDHRDLVGGGSLSYGFVSLAAGTLDIQTPAARAADALTARTNGQFGKLAFQGTRVQRLGSGPFSVSAGIGGQLASKNLDVSEKMLLGGLDGVRAYPQGEAYADEGVLINIEGRVDLPRFSARVPGQMQLLAFVDGGSVTMNKEPWAAGTNHRTLSGTGVGFNWSESGNFLVRAYYAVKLGSAPALSAPDRSGRFWFQTVKFF
jgi:hemolysin activation/secretion protein